MKIKLLIGTMLVLALYITPVVAVSGSDFEDVVEVVDGVDTYKYLNRNNLSEEYTLIETSGTHWLQSFVTFKPANIPDAPTMEVDTFSDNHVYIYLPRSVDDWEIKYYSCEEEFNLYPCKAYLKNSGVVNLNEKFGGYISQGCELDLMLSWGQCIWCPSGFPFSKIWYIPDVDKGD
jgi:hypothetical protein